MNVTEGSQNTSTRCLLAVEILRQPHLIALMLVTIGGCVAGVAPAGCLVYYLYKKPVYHNNISLLMYNMCLALSLLSIGVAYLSLDHLIAFALYRDDPCKLMSQYTTCHKQRSVALILPTSIVSYGTVAMAIERAYATYHFRTYEAQTSRRIGFSFIAVQWFLGVLGAGSNYIKMEQDNLIGTMPYCISLLITPDVAGFGMAFASSCGLLALTFFLTILVVNARQQRRKVGAGMAPLDGGHLSERYQLKENLKTTRMLIPCLAGHILVTLCAYGVGIYIASDGRLENDSDVSRLAVYNELFSTLLTLYAPIFCITCIVQSPALFSQLRDDLACLPSSKSSRITYVRESNARELHFEQLNDLWKSNAINLQLMNGP